MWIITNDTILANALQVSLRQLGLIAEISPDFPTRKNDLSGYIIDLDSIPADTVLPSPCITISRQPQKSPDLMRPFLFTDFSALALERFRATPPVQDSPALSTAQEPLLTLLPNSLRICGTQISLSPSERAIMALLINANGECVPTSALDQLWDGEGNTTAVYISYLRKKIQSVTDLQLIRSVRGKGYRLCLPR